MIGSLWSKDFKFTSQYEDPFTILEKQGKILEVITENKLIITLKSLNMNSNNGTDFKGLVIKSNNLERIPIEVYWNGKNGIIFIRFLNYFGGIEFKNIEQYKNTLSEILSSDIMTDLIEEMIYKEDK